MKMYQEIYDNVEWYGSAKHKRCPGMRLISLYETWLHYYVLDYGCGRGDVVEYLRSKGKNAYGYDIIKPEKDYCFSDFIQVYNKVEPSKASFLCIDVLEHLNKNNIRDVLEYASMFKNQIISVHNKSSKCPLTGKELHITKKPFEWWVYELSHYLEIVKVDKIHDNQMLYKCKTRVK